MVSSTQLLGIALVTLLVASGLAAAAGGYSPAAAAGGETARGPGNGVGPAADVVRSLDGHNSPWVTGDDRLDRFQARFDLTDEQMVELREDVGAMVLDGADHDAVQAEILTALERFGVENPTLGPTDGVPLGDGPRSLGPRGPADGRVGGFGTPGAGMGNAGGVGPYGPADGSCMG